MLGYYWQMSKCRIKLQPVTPSFVLSDKLLSSLIATFTCCSLTFEFWPLNNRWRLLWLMFWWAEAVWCAAAEIRYWKTQQPRLMTELQLLAWLGFSVYLSKRRGNTEEIVHYCNSEQLAAVHIKRQRKSCLMTKTDNRLQIWTSWCIPARNMKDRKYLTCAAFGKQEKIRRSSMALLCWLINLF